MMRLVTRGLEDRSSSNSHSYSTPDGPGLFLSMIYNIVKFEMSTIAKGFSPRSGNLQADAVARARECLEDSATEIGDSSKQWGSKTDSV
jgi:hypothetical protein